MSPYPTSYFLRNSLVAYPCHVDVPYSGPSFSDYHQLVLQVFAAGSLNFIQGPLLPTPIMNITLGFHIMQFSF